MWTTFAVGTPQRPENKHWRGLWRVGFGYNEFPTSSCQTSFVGRRVNDSTRLFFSLGMAHCAFASPLDVNLH
jgi:hypothetical protein